LPVARCLLVTALLCACGGDEGPDAPAVDSGRSTVDSSVPTKTTDSVSTLGLPTGDTASSTPPSTLTVSQPVAVTELGDYAEHHPAVHWTAGGGLVAYATYKGGTTEAHLVTTAVRVDADGTVHKAHPTVAGSTKPDLAPAGDRVLAAWQHGSNQIGYHFLDDAGQPDVAERLGDPDPVHAGTVDLATRTDGDVLMMWYRGDTAGSVPDPADGTYVLALLGVDGELLDGPTDWLGTPPGGGSPPDVVALPSDRAAAAVQVRYGDPDASGRYAERLELHTLGADASPEGSGTVVYDGTFTGASRPVLAASPQGELAIGLRSYEGQRSFVMVATASVDGEVQSAPVPLMEAPADTDRPTLLHTRHGWLVAFEHAPEVGELTGVSMGLLSHDAVDWVVEPQPVCAPDQRCSRPTFGGSEADGVVLVYETGAEGSTAIELVFVGL
jgi:hypothetical protein